MQPCGGSIRVSSQVLERKGGNTSEWVTYLLSGAGLGLKPSRAQLYATRNTAAAAARATRSTDCDVGDGRNTVD